MSREMWTRNNIVYVALVVSAYVCLFAYDRQIAGIAVTLPSFVVGLVGVARRRITVGGRGGRSPQTYLGWRAVLASLPFLVGGGVLSWWQAAQRWPRLLELFASAQL